MQCGRATIFNTADFAMITKMDLADACEFNLDEARRNIHCVRPDMRFLEVSSKTSQGMDAVGALVESRIPEARKTQAV